MNRIELLQSLGRVVGFAYPEDEREGWLGWVERAPAHRRLRRKIDVYGVMLHTTGTGVIRKARRKGWPDEPDAPTPYEIALNYHRKRGASHFDVDVDGTAYQLMPWNRMGAHANSPKRRRMLSGKWAKDMTRKGRADTVGRWHVRWKKPSPQHLYPTRSPNGCYVGIELRPLAEPRSDGLWFTDGQMRVAAMIALDVADRAGLPDGWHRTSRLLGHEDTSPYKRWNRRGGWDPGALRNRPRFSWQLFTSELERLAG